MTGLVVTAATHVGRVRNVNQDRIVVGPWILAPDSPAVTALGCRPGTNIVAVLDGMGGHAGGEFAATAAAEIVASFGGMVEDETAAEALVRQANDAVYKRMASIPSLAGMGTTLVGLALAGDNVVVFNVGDARAYVEADGYLLQASTDDAVDSGALTQSLGGRRVYEAVTPHIVLEPATGRRFLLASDGLFGHIDHAQIEQCLGAIAPDDDASAVGALIGLALAEGGPDNVSVVLVRVREGNELGERPG